MSNQDIRTALDYHESTKLSYINLANKPPLYKFYSGLPTVSLPRDFPHPKEDTLESVASAQPRDGASINLATLAELLFFSAGLVRMGEFSAAGKLHFRAAASAGALYPVETYIVCGEIPGLGSGVYHFSPAGFLLHQLRRGDYRAELSGAAEGQASVSTSPVTFIFTAIFWRSAWKYRTRSYRYCFWDCGTMLANLLATASAKGLPARVVAGFIDGRVNRLIDIHEDREASLCLIPIGRGEGSHNSPKPVDLPPLADQGVGPSTGEIDYPQIREIHAASCLTNGSEVAAWRGALEPEPVRGQGPMYPLQISADADGESRELGDVILHRGSTRRFSPEPIPLPTFGALLDRATRGVPADFSAPSRGGLLDVYTIVNAVDGLPSGSYFLCNQRRSLVMLTEGDFRAEAGHLCFEQALGADAGAVVFFTVDLGAVLGRFGNRGYRVAQLEAGILGGKLYLCAHALGLGASGLTFYDDDVIEFFAPDASGKSAVFAVALGITSPRNRVRPYRSRVGIELDALARGAGKGEARG